MKTPDIYKDLTELSIEIHKLTSVLSLLHWDQETFMPKGANNSRSEQIALMSSLIHEKKCSKKFKDRLEKLVNLKTGKLKVKGLGRKEAACVREIHKDYLRANKLPASFVETFSRTTSEASQIWSLAKKENNFKVFAPFLEKIVGLARKKTEILGFADHPYDALLESYEPCMTSHKVGVIFSSLQKELCQLLKKIETSKEKRAKFLEKSVDEKTQMKIGEWIASILPMDPAYSRLDLSAHPFSTAMHPNDSRITTRILPKNFMSNIFSVLHEAGHSMYEMGLPTLTWGTPLSEPASLSIHESQSRFWETLIGRGLPFWKAYYPTLQIHLPHLKKVPLETFYKKINHVEPSFIRVEADEVTYGLHVIVRFEVEKELISGNLSVTDLPSFWNHKMKEYLGITPPTDSLGCLQDIHWSLGDFGYFPTYALGNLFAAQFMSGFSKEHPDWEKRVAKGELAFIREWLRENIHSSGRIYNAEELAKKITGKTLTEKFYTQYLKKKYSKIYEF